MHDFLNRIAKPVIRFQTRFAWALLIFGVLLSAVCAPSALGLLTTVKTELMHLLPDHYPSVSYLPHIKKLFNRRNSLAVVLTSPHPEANERAMFDLREYFLQHPDVESVTYDKPGFDFFNEHKLLLLDLKDLYSIHDRLKDKIQKRKLGSLYIDFEDEDSSGERTDDVTFDDFVDKYKKEYMGGVQSRYLKSEDGTVYVIKVFPKNQDSSLKYYEKYGKTMREYLKGFNFKSYHPEMEYGFSGPIVGRVNQYKALMNDLKKAGLISAVSIFALLFWYFSRFIRKQQGVWGFVKTQLTRAVPVLAVFIPMIFSTLYAFSFNSFFFKQLNVVTSFLFAIIFGLGVDIGIHLISRYIHDTRAKIPYENIQWNVMTRTGITVIISVLTTVATFYILIVNDFRGFSEFGWIAGNGLIIALITYIIFTPSLIALIHRYRLMPLKPIEGTQEEIVVRGKRWLPRPKLILASFAIISLLALWGAFSLRFEWNFEKLKQVVPETERWNRLQEKTSGRVNSATTFLVQTPVQARKIRQALRERRDHAPQDTTLEWFRSYFDMVPFDQAERLAVLEKIRVQLNDDALNAVSDDEKELIDLFKKEIGATRIVTEDDVPEEIKSLFWGSERTSGISAGFAAPLSKLELDDGNNARAFYRDAAEVDVLGQKYYSTSESIIFADVVQTLFYDSRVAVSLCLLVMAVLIGLHFRNSKRSLIVYLGLGCGIFWMLGLQEVFNLRLNFYNMIVIPAMIGMGEDNSVHMVDRFDEFGRKSILHVLRTVGGAAFMASATTILGYSGLCFVNHPGLKSIGLMAVLGMGMCLLSSLVLVPVLLQVFIGKNNN